MVKNKSSFPNEQALIKLVYLAVEGVCEIFCVNPFFLTCPPALLQLHSESTELESIADRIAVMHEGKIVEEAGTDYLIKYPHHPYTKSLLRSVLDVDPTTRRPVKRRISVLTEPTLK